MCALDNPVVGTHDCGDGGEEDTQTRHEGEEGGGGVDDLPGDHDPGCCDCGDDHTAANVDVLWEEGGHVVGTGDDVGGQVGTDLSNDPGEADEECSCAARGAFPLCGESERIPDVRPIDHLCGGGGDDAEESEAELDEWEEQDLPVHTLLALEVTSEIGDVGCHGSPAASNGRQAGENKPGAHGTIDFVLLLPDVTRSAGLLAHSNYDSNAGNADDHYRMVRDVTEKLCQVTYQT